MLLCSAPLNPKVRRPIGDFRMQDATLKLALMRRTRSVLAAGVLALALVSSAFAGDDPAVSAAPISCDNGIPGGVNCIVTKKDLKEGRNAYVRGLKLQDHQHLEEALAQFDEASRLVPQNAQYLTARELVKAHLVFNHIERGNTLLAEDLESRAAIEFRNALELDSDNEFARERLVEATRELDPAVAKLAASTKIEDSGEIRVQPKNELATFNFRGDVRGLLAEVASAYGVTTEFADSVVAKQARFTVDNVDFFTPMNLPSETINPLFPPLNSRHALNPPPTPEHPPPH